MKKLLFVFLYTLVTVSIDATEDVLTVNDSIFQHVTGFGAAAMGDLMCPIQDTIIIAKLYGKDSSVGLNILRIEISPDGANSSNDSQWYDSPYDWNGYINAVKCARAHGAIVLGTPWSPPAMFKTNNSTSGQDSLGIGARLRTNCYSLFFNWLNTFCAYMKGKGAPVDIVSIQNEPDYTASYSGCLYTPTEMHTLVAKYAKRFTGAKLMGGESYNYTTSYTDSLLNDSNTCKYISYIGGHFYSGGIKRASKAAANAMAHGIEAWETEHYVDPRNDNSKGKIIDSPLWSEQILFANEINDAMNSNLSAYVYWYMRCNNGFMGDGKSVPSGKGNEDMVISTRGYLMSHFTKYIIGARRIGSSISNKNIKTSAYIKGDSLIVIIINNGSLPSKMAFNLPFCVKSVSNQVSVESSICQKEYIDIVSPGKLFSSDILPSSINTFCFIIDWNKTGIKPFRVTNNQSEKVVFNLQGLRIKTTSSRDPLDGLSHGIYIVDGRKIVK